MEEKINNIVESTVKIIAERIGDIYTKIEEEINPPDQKDEDFLDLESFMHMIADRIIEIIEDCENVEEEQFHYQ